MNLPAIQETEVQSLGWEDCQEKGMAKYSCPGNPMVREPGGLHSPWGHKELDMSEAT